MFVLFQKYFTVKIEKKGESLRVAGFQDIIKVAEVLIIEALLQNPSEKSFFNNSAGLQVY